MMKGLLLIGALGALAMVSSAEDCVAHFGKSDMEEMDKDCKSECDLRSYDGEMFERRAGWNNVTRCQCINYESGDAPFTVCPDDDSSYFDDYYYYEYSSGFDVLGCLEDHCGFEYRACLADDTCAGEFAEASAGDDDAGPSAAFSAAQGAKFQALYACYVDECEPRIAYGDDDYALTMSDQFRAAQVLMSECYPDYESEYDNVYIGDDEDAQEEACASRPGCSMQVIKMPKTMAHRAKLGWEFFADDYDYDDYEEYFNEQQALGGWDKECLPDDFAKKLKKTGFSFDVFELKHHTCDMHRGNDLGCSKAGCLWDRDLSCTADHTKHGIIGKAPAGPSKAEIAANAALVAAKAEVTTACARRSARAAHQSAACTQAMQVLANAEQAVDNFESDSAFTTAAPLVVVAAAAAAALF